METVTVPGNKPVRLLKWMVKPGDWVNYGTSLIVYRCIEDPSTGLKSKETELKSKKVGRVKKLVMEVGQVAKPGVEILVLDSCTHPVVMKDMCAECGVDLRLLKGRVNKQAQVSMVPNIPELKISEQQATELGEQDKARLHKLNKLVLLVDLDQTLIHTTQNQAFAHMCKDEEDFFTFQLHKNEPTLYTKLRPYCREFLLAISKCYELQVVTFGSRMYAHKIAEFIDPNKKYFANRILSRDECINPLRKSGNLRYLFPCGDSMVCIIDDRDDVWSGVPNLIMVRKYSYFPGSGDINSPDKMEAKKETDSRKDQVSPKEPATSCTTKQNATTPQAEAGDATNPRKRKSETDDNEKSAKMIKNSVTCDREPEENQNGNIGKSESVIMKDLEEEQKRENRNEEGKDKSNEQEG
uniref:RNA polymerase II subunit A C-terminal domain phosphatase n=1 Tax=Ciona savignyi TaxID=51511 RepID=H2YDS9_CIOSA